MNKAKRTNERMQQKGQNIKVNEQKIDVVHAVASFHFGSLGPCSPHAFVTFSSFR